jgi:hypothetical protein
MKPVKKKTGCQAIVMTAEREDAMAIMEQPGVLGQETMDG